MRFFKSFYNSLWNFNWLKSQRSVRGWAWGYFTLLVLLTTLTITLPIALILPSAAQSFRQELDKAPNFELSLKGGVLNISGVEQPYSNREEGLIIIDTTTSTDIYAFASSMRGSSTTVLAVFDEGMFIANNGKEEIHSFKNFPDFSTSKTEVIEIVGRYTKPGILVLALLALTALFFVGLFIVKLIAVEIASLLVWFVALALKKGWTRSELMHVGMFAVTLPTVIQLLVSFLPIEIPFVHFLALLAFMVALVVTNDEQAKSIDTTTKSV